MSDPFCWVALTFVGVGNYLLCRAGSVVHHEPPSLPGHPARGVCSPHLHQLNQLDALQPTWSIWAGGFCESCSRRAHVSMPTDGLQLDDRLRRLSRPGGCILHSRLSFWDCLGPMRLPRRMDGSRTHGTFIARGLARSQPAGQPEALWLALRSQWLSPFCPETTPAPVIPNGGSISSTAPPARRRDTRGPNGPQDTSYPPLRVCPWALSGRGKGSESTGQLLAGRESSQVSVPNTTEPQFRKSAWLGHGPPPSVSPPCRPMLRHNGVGQTAL